MANPYGELLLLMNSNGNPSSNNFYIGLVSNNLPNLKIKFEGEEVDKEDFLINNSLIINNNANITCSDGTITHNLKDVLNVGDKVLILNVNDTYIVLSKVVGL